MEIFQADGEEGLFQGCNFDLIIRKVATTHTMSQQPNKKMKTAMQNQQSGAQPSDADTARRGLMSLNKLTYTLDPDLSVCVARSYKTHNFQTPVYKPGERAICILNSGADYIAPDTSYLSMTVKNTSDSPITWGPNGSCLNLISRIVLTSRSGEEIERIDRPNFLWSLKDPYHKGSDWFKSVGSAQGYCDREAYQRGGFPIGQPSPEMIAGSANLDAGSSAWVHKYTSLEAGNVIPSQGAATFQILLSGFSGLFESTTRLLPSHLMSGLRFEITLEQPQTCCTKLGTYGNGEFVFTPPTAVAASLEIIKMNIVLDSYTLTDSVQRALNEIAATSGLEIPFKSYYYSPTALNGGSGNSEIRKAVSRALQVITTFFPADGVIPDSVGTNSFATSFFGLKYFQTRVGALYFPQQPKSQLMNGSKSISLGSESYTSSVRGFGRLNTPSAPPCISLARYQQSKPLTCTLGKNTPLLAPCMRDNQWVICTDLERSTTQALSGIPVNSSRVIEVNWQLVADHENPANFVQCNWLCYTRLLRVWINSVDVAE
jgi:hypothetical protein